MADNRRTFAELEAGSSAEPGVVDHLWIERLKDELRGLPGQQVGPRSSDPNAEVLAIVDDNMR